MTSREWWKEAVVYEVYVDKFATDFKGFVARLGYFHHLGINTLHILPHYPSPMVDDGYDVSDYMNVRASLGTLEDFTAFTKAAHDAGIRVIVDLVLNHVSSEHPWFREARASKDNPRRDYFLWSDEGSELRDAPNPFSDFKPSNWIKNEPTQDYYYATFYPEQPDVNWSNPEVLREILAVIDFWVAHGVDGFRLDAAPYLFESIRGDTHDVEATHAIIRAIRNHLDDAYGGRIILVAEVGDVYTLAKAYFGIANECHIAYHFSLSAEMFLSLARGDDTRVRAMAKASFDIPLECAWGIFLRNHDEVWTGSLSAGEQEEVRAFLDPANRYPFRRGTRTAIRLGSAFGGDTRRLIEAFQLQFSLPGVPFLYYGEEIGMLNLPLQEGIVDSRKYVRGDFDWHTAERMQKDPDSLLNAVAGMIRSHASP